MADGSHKAIENVKEGNSVQSRDEATGKTKPCKVLKTSSHEEKKVLHLTFTDAANSGKSGKSGKIVSEIRCTVEHPFYVKGKGWVAAQDLGIGTEIVTRAGPTVRVKSVVEEAHPKGVRVYNFEVEGIHNYFVGNGQGNANEKDGIWVHNQSKLGERFVRYGSATEAETTAAEQALSHRPGHRGPDGGLKWISEEGNVDPSTLGKGSNYSHRMDVLTKPGTREWLQQFDGAWKNEPGRYGIPTDALGEFNDRIIRIMVSPLK